MSAAPRIALISATSAAIEPAATAVSKSIPSARIWNLLDDRLLADKQEAGGVDGEMWHRMESLIRYALDGRADGVLLTCSQYGEVARALAEVERRAPILAADDAAFDAVVAGGFRRVLILSSLESALADTSDRLGRQLASSLAATELVGRVVPGAVHAAGRGQDDGLSRLLKEAIDDVPDTDAVLLAQYSLAIAQSALAELVSVPVLAGPVLAAQRLAEELGHQ
jgi:hypothetical protein